MLGWGGAGAQLERLATGGYGDASWLQKTRPDPDPQAAQEALALSTLTCGCTLSEPWHAHSSGG